MITAATKEMHSSCLRGGVACLQAQGQLNRSGSRADQAHDEHSTSRDDHVIAQNCLAQCSACACSRYMQQPDSECQDAAQIPEQPHSRAVQQVLWAQWSNCTGHPPGFLSCSLTSRVSSCQASAPSSKRKGCSMDSAPAVVNVPSSFLDRSSTSACRHGTGSQCNALLPAQELSAL